jgi:beta-lactamase class A
LLVSGCVTAATVAPPAHPSPPAHLARRIQALGQAFDGQVGIAVEDVQSGWVAAYDGTRLFPQQSVAKLWVALAVFDAVDRGRLNLSDPITVRTDDMSVFNQPIQKKLVDGRYDTSVDGLLVWALAQSDNAANDILIRKLDGAGLDRLMNAIDGGPVRALIRRRGLGAIRAGEEERTLEAKIAGLSWKREYSFGRAFWEDRDKLPLSLRQAKLDAYLADPADGASPDAVVDGLARLQRGELLSAASTARFLQIMAMTDTGPLRLHAGLGPGWRIAHKTGTGQDLGDQSTGYNDVGLLTAPDGRIYAVAVMIGSTRRPIPERQALMADVARATVAEHDAEFGAPAVSAPP